MNLHENIKASGVPITKHDWREAFGNSGKIGWMLIEGVEIRDINYRDAAESMLDVLSFAEELLGKTPETVAPGDITLNGSNGGAALWMNRALHWRATGTFTHSDAMLVLRCVRLVKQKYGRIPPEPEKPAKPVIEEIPIPIIETIPTMVVEPVIETQQHVLEEDLYNILGLEEDSGRPRKKGSKNK